MHTLLASFGVIGVIVLALMLFFGIMFIGFYCLLGFIIRPIYCAPYWWYAGNKRCDGWYRSDDRMWTDIKKATYIYYCWITRRKTPED